MSVIDTSLGLNPTDLENFEKLFLKVLYLNSFWLTKLSSGEPSYAANNSSASGSGKQKYTLQVAHR
jgi:hypothetical protein